MRSYRELPLRLFEFGTRVPLREVGRGARPDARAGHDAGRRAHLLHEGADGRRARTSLLGSCSTLLRDYGLDDFYLELSTTPEGKAVGQPTRSGTRRPRRSAPRRARWTSSSSSTRAAARSTGRRSRCRRATRSAARGSCRRSRSTSRCRSASSCEYVGADNERHQPIMIHRALFGAIERFFAILVEHYAGAFPTWLAPVQVTVLPVADRHDAYASRIADRLRAEGFRAEERRGAHADTLGRADPPGEDREGPVRARRGRRRRRRRDRRREPAGQRRPRAGCTGRRLRRAARGRGRGRARTDDASSGSGPGWRAELHGTVSAGAELPATSASSAGWRATRTADEALVVERNDLVFAVLNAYPYTSGHLMVVPRPPRGRARRARRPTRRAR